MGGMSVVGVVAHQWGACQWWGWWHISVSRDGISGADVLTAVGADDSGWCTAVSADVLPKADADI